METRIIAFDVESTGLEESDRLFGYSIAEKDYAAFFRHQPDEQLRTLAKDPSVTWIGQNIIFDMRMAGYSGVEFVGDVVDIGIMARLLKNNRGPRDYSLAAQAKRHLNQEKIDEVAKVIKDNKLYQIRKDFFGEEYKVPCFQDVDHELMNKYGAMDARLTYDLYQYYLSQMDEGSLQVLNNESKLTKVLYKMERTGIKIDKDYTLRAYYYESDKAEEARNKYKEETGFEFVNSGVAIEKSLGLTLPKTEKGNPTLTDEVIDKMVRQYPSLDFVRKIRYHEKRLTTYFKNYLNAQSDSIIRPSFHQYGTTTGRFSSSNPNLQNVVAEDDGEYPVRGCFIPHEGDVFLAIDYKAQEFRLALDYSGETKLIRDIMDGADPHQATADLAGISRKHAKTLNFGLIYGASASKIGEMLSIPEKESKQLVLQYFARLPRLEHFLWQVQSVGKTRGYVRNWFGRKLYADYEHCYALPNHLIQSSGSDVIKCAMVKIYDLIKNTDVKLLLSIHDELVFSLPEKDLNIAKDIQKIMETQYKSFNGMVLHTDASVSRKSFAKKDMEKLYGA